MPAGLQGSIINGLGPLVGILGLPTATLPMVGPGIANKSINAAAQRLVVASTSPGKTRRLKIACLTAGAFIGYTTVAPGDAATASTMTATGTATATDGSIIPGGSFEWISIPDNEDLWIAASGAATAIQVTLVEGT